MNKFIFAIDQGTTSSKVAVVCKNTLDILYKYQKPCNNIYQKPGWSELNATDLYQDVKSLCLEALKQLLSTNINSNNSFHIKIGITNQRETCLIWDKHSKKPLTNAIIWNDLRNADMVNNYIISKNNNQYYYKSKTGLPISTYFSALKYKWLAEEYNLDLLNNDNLCLGTIDSWLIYNLTNKKSFYTDTTNASRTMLMNINNLEYDQDILNEFKINVNCLPKIMCSSDNYGIAEDLLNSLDIKDKNIYISINGVIGDQQSACLGHCLNNNEIKATYGTGGFILMNTGNKLVNSKNELLSTVLYTKNNADINKNQNSTVYYALEGAIETAGNTLTFLKNNFNFIKENYSETSELFNSVKDNGGVVFVPCFSGLFTPYWDNQAKASIFGLTTNTQIGHIIRATLEAICFRTLEVKNSFEKESKSIINEIKIDGGLANNEDFLSLAANILNCSIIVKEETEITLIGAAIAAGLGSNIYSSIEDVKKIKLNKRSYNPDNNSKDNVDCEENFKKWKLAIEKCRHWN